MIRCTQNGLEWFEFELLANCSNVVHAVFTRHGGCSQGHLASLNLGKNIGDKLENVVENRLKVAKALQLPQLFSGKQCHGKDIVAFTESLLQDECPVCDGLSTQIQNVGLMITQADCQAAIFYDPIHHALANIHCGWRGNVQNIYLHAVQHMQKTYHSKPQDLLVCISPSLGPQNSEFMHYQTELPESFWEFQIKPTYFDFWAISEWQLKQAGILPNHIQIARLDTFANAQDYFSYRREKETGRQATICALS